MKGKTKNKNYEVKVMCRNCGKGGRIRIPLGTSIDLKPCPHCGNLTLHNLAYYGLSD